MGITYRDPSSAGRITRRQALKTGVAAGAGLLLPWKGFVRRAYGSALVPQEPLAGSAIPRFVEPLPHFAGTYAGLTRVTGPAITVAMGEARQKVLPASFYAGLAAPFSDGTYVWGYNVGGKGTLYPGVSVEARRGVPTQITYTNALSGPDMYPYLTVDQTLHWANPLNQPMSMTPYTGPAPVAPHLHGGEVPPQFDGGPDAWFTPGGLRGHGYATTSGITAPADGAIYTYPNSQEATTLWFHDHALGITRINVYAGLAAFYLLRDDWDTGDGFNVPGFPFGPYEIEIAIQDRMFDTNGQWFFPDDEPPNPEDHPFWIPEFTGDAIVVNGKTWPYLDVEPRRYRFRILNGSNARTYELFLTNPSTKGNGPSVWQIGTDGGLLDAPVGVDPNLKAKLVMMPGERADVIIDFSGHQGQTLLLRNTAKTPFPAGETPHGATLGQIMQFRVVSPLAAPDTSYNPAASAQPLRPLPIVRLASGAALADGVEPAVTRQFTLNEVMGMGGPLEVLVNNTKYMGTDRDDFIAVPNSDGTTTYYSEAPVEGTTEMWEVVNITADAHPIHLHLVQFQIVNRQGINAEAYEEAYEASFPGGEYIPGSGPPLDYTTGNARALGGNPDVTPFLKGPLMPPAANEAGWKDTVVMLPRQVTRIAVRFAPTDKAVDAPDLYYPFDPNGGHGFVWHCHIIDHEDNEMMRPYSVTPVPAAPRTFAP